MTVANTPAANTQVMLFKADAQFYASNLFMCAAGGEDTCFVGVKPAGEDQVSWFYSGLALHSSETFVVTALSFSDGDEVYVKSGNGRVSFTMTGDIL